MRNMWSKVLKYLKKVFLTLAATSGAAFIISLITRFRLSRVLLTASLIYMFIGGTAILGILGNISGSHHKHARGSELDTDSDNSSKIGNPKEENMGTLLFMSLVGFLLMIIGFIFDAVQM